MLESAGKRRGVSVEDLSQQAMVASVCTPQVKLLSSLPGLVATCLKVPEGANDCPPSLDPQQEIEPSGFTAQVLPPPAATWTAMNASKQVTPSEDRDQPGSQEQAYPPMVLLQMPCWRSHPSVL